MKKLAGGLLAWLLLPIVNAQPSLTLEDIFLTNKYYASKGPDTYFLYGEDAYAERAGDEVNVYDHKGIFVRTLLTCDKYQALTGDSICFDKISLLPGNLLLLSSAEEDIYRHSTQARHSIYDPGNDRLAELGDSRKIRYPILSPDGQLVAYVYQNNIYIQSIASGAKMQVTIDGEEGKIINGHSDWLYEEEFDLLEAMAWTSDSRKLAFLRFDETNVEEYLLEKYAGAAKPLRYSYKYPKTGEKNATVSLHVFDVDMHSISSFVLPENVEYVPRVYTFPDPDKVFVAVLDRAQKDMRLVAYDISTRSGEIWYRETDTAYVEVPLWIDADELGKLWITSEKDGYVNIYSSAGELSKQITSDHADITEVYGRDRSGSIYYQRTSRAGIEREVCRVDTNGSITILSKGGTIEAEFSPGYTIAKVTRSTLEYPFEVVLQEIASGKEVQILWRYNAFKEFLQSLGQDIDFMTLPLNGYDMSAWMLKPAHFNPRKKYPLLVTVYGGPGDQNVKNRWDYSTFMWYRYLAQQGIVVVAIENRGSMGRGAAFKKIAYKLLGSIDVADQLQAAKYFGSLNYIDESRMAIYGWSYGGFMSLMCLLEGGSTFKAGVAIAPVTHWKFYNSAYSERYMGLLPDNKLNYDRYAPVNLAGKLQGDLLIAHGTMDDNVHFQNSMEMVRALNYAGKTYEFVPYPNRDHNIAGGNTRYHLYSGVTRFLLEKLK